MVSFWGVINIHDVNTHKTFHRFDEDGGKIWKRNVKE